MLIAFLFYKSRVEIFRFQSKLIQSFWSDWLFAKIGVWFSQNFYGFASYLPCKFEWLLKQVYSFLNLMVATLYYKEGATTLSRQLFAQFRLEPREQTELTPDNPFEVVWCQSRMYSKEFKSPIDILKSFPGDFDKFLKKSIFWWSWTDDRPHVNGQFSNIYGWYLNKDFKYR